MKGDLHKDASGKIFEFARELRQDETLPEKILWEKLRGRSLKGFKFRRQHPIGQFIADFYCHEVNLIIELDGSIHDIPEINKYDVERSHELKSLGLRIIRFRNKDVIEDIGGVLRAISNHLIPSPSPEGEGR